MPSKASFAHVTPLRGDQAPLSHSAAIRIRRRARQSAESPTVSDTFLALGLLIIITIGLIALRAAIWLPPLDV